MSDPRYADGDVVWCKCGGLFWPGEVKALASLPEEIREGFLRTPLVVVKFFDEDGYEFVLNENNIYLYNCQKKTDFIQKGIARYRSKTKEGVTEGWYAKFPKDVVLCEQLTGGNINILEEPPFAERKEPKVDYNKIFSDPVIEVKKQKVKTPNAKVDIKKENSSPNVSSTKSKKKSETSQKTPSTPKITHPRFLKGGSDHEVRILTQASSPYVFNSDLLGDFGFEKPSALYRCPMCDFAATRVNVVVLHSKSHSQTQVSYAVKPVPKIKTISADSTANKTKEIKQSVKKEEKSKTFLDTPASKKKVKTVSSSTPVAVNKLEERLVSGKKRPSPAPLKVEKKSTPVPNKKPRMSKKDKEEKEKRVKEKVQLLMEWSEDEDEEAEEFKKIQESINQSLQADFSDDEEVDDVFKRDEHHYSVDSDDEQPFTSRTKIDFNRAGSNTSLKTPHSARFEDNKCSPLPNKEHVTSRSSQDSPAESSQDSPAGINSPSRSSQSSPASLSSHFISSPTTKEPRTGSSASKKCNSPAASNKESPFSNLVNSSSNGTMSEKEGNSHCQREQAVQDLFDIDKALQETEVPEVPSLTSFTKFSDFSAFKKKQKLLSKTMSPNKEDENQNTSDAVTDSPSEVDDFDFDNNDDNLFISPLKKIKRTVSPKHSLKQEQTIDSPSKFSTLSAKAKAKQLARQAAALHNKDLKPEVPNSNIDQTPTSDNKDDLINSDNSNSSSLEDTSAKNSVKDDSAFSPVHQLTVNSPSIVPLSPSKHSPIAKSMSMATPVRNGKYDLNEENLGKLVLTPATAASLAAAVTTLGQLSPAPVMGITQLSSPSTIASISVGGCGTMEGLATTGSCASGLIEAPEGSELEEGEDEQIYYMLVDEGSQLENQTILIDEAQLAAAGGQPGNVIIQQSDGGLIMDTSTRTVYLQDATSGHLVNVVVADDKDVISPVSLADTSGGVAILPNHPSSSMHSQVPLITTPSGKTPIMISDNPNQENR